MPKDLFVADVMPPEKPLLVTYVNEQSSSLESSWFGLAGNEYFAEASTNLINWQTLWRTTAETNGFLSFAQPVDPERKQLFLRIGTRNP